MGEELQCVLMDENLKKYLEALDVTADDTFMLFKLLDKDNSDAINIDEFCDGCMRLRGEAKSFDIHILVYQVRQFLSKWSGFTVYVEERFSGMEQNHELSI